MVISPSVTVVIRAAGERTENVCKKLIIKQGIEEKNIVVVKEKPFAAAVKKTFEIGISNNKDWTLAIDADILLSDNAIYKLINWAESQADYFFEFQGRVVDKFFCAPRPGGPHLYRNKYLKKAIDFIPKDKNALRPESYTYHKMAEIGFHYYHHPEIYGIHDYYQYYKDIYRKAFLQAHKHTQHVGYFVKQWAKHKNEDKDYEVALNGLIDGLGSQNKIEVNIDFFKEYIDKSFDENNFSEKEELDPGKIIQIDKIITSWNENEEAAAFEKANLHLHRRSDTFLKKNTNQAIKTKFFKYLSKLLWRMGSYSEKLANY